MSLHDSYARRTPFELAFPDAGLLGRLASDVTAEAAARGVDATDPGAFLSLGGVARAVAELGDSAEGVDAAFRFGPLLFHGVHFTRCGQPLFLLPTGLVRDLIGRRPDGDPEPPAGAGYLQLPQHLFWVAGEDDDRPESLDGGFWTVSDTGMLHVLLITGVRPDRPGFGTFALPAAPMRDAEAWSRADVREGGPDYASAIAGGDLDGLYSVQAAGEAFKLLARFFAYARARPGSLAAHTPPEGAPAGPAPSALPYTRVDLVA